jgi:hypothetical protein
MAGLRHEDLTVPQGTTWQASWPMVDDAGAPLLVDGWDVQGQVRSSASSATVLHTWSSSDGSAEATGSTVSVSVTPAVSTAWAWRTGVYDVEVTDPAGPVLRVVQGRVLVDREITR